MTNINQQEPTMNNYVVSEPNIISPSSSANDDSHDTAGSTNRRNNITTNRRSSCNNTNSNTRRHDRPKKSNSCRSPKYLWLMTQSFSSDTWGVDSFVIGLVICVYVLYEIVAQWIMRCIIMFSVASIAKGNNAGDIDAVWHAIVTTIPVVIAQGLICGLKIFATEWWGLRIRIALTRKLHTVYYGKQHVMTKHRPLPVVERGGSSLITQPNSTSTFLNANPVTSTTTLSDLPMHKDALIAHEHRICENIDHRICEDTLGFSHYMPNLLVTGLVLPPTVTWYTFTITASLDSRVILTLYGTFLIAVLSVIPLTLKLLKTRYVQQNLEGDFRLFHANQRVFREEIVLLKGLPNEESRATKFFNFATTNQWYLCRRHGCLEALTKFWAYVGSPITWGVVALVFLSTVHPDPSKDDPNTIAARIAIVQGMVQNCMYLLSKFTDIIALSHIWTDVAGYGDRLIDVFNAGFLLATETKNSEMLLAKQERHMITFSPEKERKEGNTNTTSSTEEKTNHEQRESMKLAGVRNNAIATSDTSTKVCVVTNSYSSPSFNSYASDIIEGCAAPQKTTHQSNNSTSLPNSPLSGNVMSRANVNNNKNNTSDPRRQRSESKKPLLTDYYTSDSSNVCNRNGEYHTATTVAEANKSASFNKENVDKTVNSCVKRLTSSTKEEKHHLLMCVDRVDVHVPFANACVDDCSVANCRSRSRRRRRGRSQSNISDSHSSLCSTQTPSNNSKSLLLRDFSLRIYRKQHVVIRGPSGCGKTSLLRVLTGFAPPKYDPRTDHKFFSYDCLLGGNRRIRIPTMKGEEEDAGKVQQRHFPLSKSSSADTNTPLQNDDGENNRNPSSLSRKLEDEFQADDEYSSPPQQSETQVAKKTKCKKIPSRISIHPDLELLILPQRPYLFKGTLYEVLYYGSNLTRSSKKCSNNNHSSAQEQNNNHHHSCSYDIIFPKLLAQLLSSDVADELLKIVGSSNTSGESLYQNDEHIGCNALDVMSFRFCIHILHYLGLGRLLSRLQDGTYERRRNNGEGAQCHRKRNSMHIGGNTATPVRECYIDTTNEQEDSISNKSPRITTPLLREVMMTHVVDWPSILSVGEAQRVGAVRILLRLFQLHVQNQQESYNTDSGSTTNNYSANITKAVNGSCCPDVLLFIDEGTSQLDERMECKLFRLFQAFSHCTFVSISHRFHPDVRAIHPIEVEFLDDASGDYIIRDVTNTQEKR